MDIKTADKLQKLRKAHGLSQDALAEKLGISRQSISKWERGESSPDTNNLITLAKIYGISLDELLDYDKEVKPPKEEPKEPEQKKKGKAKYAELGKTMFKFPMPIIIAVIYLVASYLTKMWHPLWIVFILIPIYYHFAGACMCKSKKGFIMAMPIPEIVIMAYLIGGFFVGGWGACAILFLIIPLYYWIGAFTKN